MDLKDGKTKAEVLSEDALRLVSPIILVKCLAELGG